MNRLLFAIIALGTTFMLPAQENCSFTHYSSEEGLSQNTVMNILQDHKGIMWFATWDGINKFNGYSFKTYKAGQGSPSSLANNRVDYMYEDKYGYLWVQTYDNKAHRFNPYMETFEQVPAKGKETSLNITSIKVLPNGIVWLLTENTGVIRVTTHTETHLLQPKFFPANSDTFPARTLLDVCMDKAGNEWLLTDNGLGVIRSGEKVPSFYFTETDQPFYAFQENETEVFFGSNNGRVWRYKKSNESFRLLELPVKSRISSINTITSKEILITTLTNVFFTCRLSDEEINEYAPVAYKSPLNAPIRSAFVDSQSEVWFEQEIAGCVVHFNPMNKVIKREQMKVEPTGADRSWPAFHVFEDVNGQVWVHPFGGGMSRFDRVKNTLVPFYNEPGSKSWRFSNKIHSAFSDRQGNLWMGTHSKGLEKITFRPIQFHLIIPNLHDERESLSNEVRALLEDSDQNIWVGLKNGTLRIYDSKYNYKGYLTESGTVAKTGKPVKGVTYSLMQDRKGIIWIATKGDGLIRAEKKTNSQTYTFTRYKYNADDIYSLSNDNVYCTYEDGKGRIWVATYAGGLNYMDTNERGETVFINHRNNLKGFPIATCLKVRFITSDHEGRLWVGTTTGALSFDGDFTNPEKVVFNYYSRIPEDPNSLSNNDVHWIIETKQHELFLATFGGGLNKLVSIEKDGHAKFKSYSAADGMPSDVLLSICEDDKENLWISTEHGISKFIPSEEKFENYDDRSIIFHVRFSEAASAKTSDGNILFGSANGIFKFNPGSIYKSNYVPPIILSQLLITNQEVVPGKNSVLKKGLDETRKLELTHEEDIFAIQYAALDYTNPVNTQYAYMLEGFDKQWVYADKQRNATYTNLSKGNYTFKVKSTNSEGVWVDNTRLLDITILPSFWETPLAYVLYIVIVLLIILTTVYILFTIYRLKHEVSIEQQISDIKLRFFTDISHELRTPLTLIAGPVEYVLNNKELPADVREQLTVVERNTNRMLRLVNQILDFRKIQNKKMKMQVQRINIVPFVRKIMENFDSLAEEHYIDYVFESEKDNLYLWVDEDKFEKIVFNLLSNAFKYTPANKMIKVFIREDESTVTIEVRDQGIGIAENKKNSIFIRFEILVDKNFFNQSSTGIGLSLVKELTEMHKASITVDSKLGEGSCFKVEFLKGKEHYDKTVEFILEDINVILSPSKVTEMDILQTETDEPANTEERLQKIMLLVEDNQELRYFLRSIFAQDFQIIEATNGMEGIDKAVKFLPDIIISDVMMPEKDGIEMTRELRTDLSVSHIPIILLTAKSSIESKLEGLEYGADDYITKPFSATYLRARVKNLLEQRVNLQRLYRDQLTGKSSSPKPEERAKQIMLSIDRRFMDKLMELMEKNMDNGDLTIDDLVNELTVSRSVFFKKLKALTGLAPIEFIKEVRIKRAAQLIETGEFTMSQITYMVGINDPRYFSRCFKQKIGLTPTEYKDKILKGDNIR